MSDGTLLVTSEDLAPGLIRPRVRLQLWPASSNFVTTWTERDTLITAWPAADVEIRFTHGHSTLHGYIDSDGTLSLKRVEPFVLPTGAREVEEWGRQFQAVARVISHYGAWIDEFIELRMRGLLPGSYAVKALPAVPKKPRWSFLGTGTVRG